VAAAVLVSTVVFPHDVLSTRIVLAIDPGEIDVGIRTRAGKRRTRAENGGNAAWRGYLPMRQAQRREAPPCRPERRQAAATVRESTATLAVAGAERLELFKPPGPCIPSPPTVAGASATTGRWCSFAAASLTWAWVPRPCSRSTENPMAWAGSTTMELAERWKQCSRGDQRIHFLGPGVQPPLPAGFRLVLRRRWAGIVLLRPELALSSFRWAAAARVAGLADTPRPCAKSALGSDAQAFSAATLEARTARPVREGTTRGRRASPQPRRSCCSALGRRASRHPQPNDRGHRPPDRGHQPPDRDPFGRPRSVAGWRDQARNCSKMALLEYRSAAVESVGGRARGDRDLFPSFRIRLPAA